MKARKSFLGMTIGFTAWASTFLFEAAKATMSAIIYVIVVRIVQKVYPPDEKK